MRISVNRVIRQFFGVGIKACNNFHVFFFGDNVSDDLAHAAIAAAESNFQHLFVLLILPA